MTAAPAQTVFVVDDDAGVGDSIAELVESVGMRAKIFNSAQAFLDALEPGQPGCLVLDVRMPEMSGLALQQRLNDMGAAIPIIMITGHGDVPIAVQAMKAGAFDFLQKPYREQALLDSINAALEADTAARNSAATAGQFGQSLEALTDRETEVLDHVLAGETSKQIARALGISSRTAEAHRRNLLRKLRVGTVKELLLRYPTRRHHR